MHATLQHTIISGYQVGTKGLLIYMNELVKGRYIHQTLDPTSILNNGIPRY